MRRGWAARLAAAAALGAALAAPAPAEAFEWSAVRGHAGLGVAQLVSPSDAPGGSLSVGGGLDVPVASGWRAGVAIGYHMLGSETARSGSGTGSLVANLDYNGFETMALAHWEPRGLGPLARVSLGAGVFNGHVEISATGGGGAAFRERARSDTAPALGLDATLMRGRRAPVRVGLELSTRMAFFDEDPWTMAAARVVFHY